MSDPETVGCDLLVIGAGHLGLRVLGSWRRAFPAARVLAETRSASRHAELGHLGADVRLRDDPEPSRYSSVLVSLPPSAVDDYRQEMERAVRLWSGTGRLVMVSSTAVYAEEDGGLCEEDSPLAATPRARRLLEAEAVIHAAGGIAVRLAGLYDEHRGPHMVYLRTETSTRRPDGFINLIHYDDAAELCTVALRKGESGATYVGCDDKPMPRQALVTATWASDRFSRPGTSRQCVFTGKEGPLGRRCQNDRTRKLLGWKPRYPSFSDWLA
jgi:nucleoside-diphosphate-sugar epimerase